MDYETLVSINELKGYRITHLQLEQFSTEHGFMVTNSLITPVILGIDFLSKHKVRLDYSTDPVSIHVGGLAVTSGRGSSSNATPSYMYVTSTAGGENDEVEEIAIPNFGDEVEYDIPPAPAELRDLVKRFEVLFSTVPGSTTVAHHTIPTADRPPVRVPPRRVPTHYRTEVERQLTEMLDRNIIRVSSSPWLVPAVYVPKKSGEIRICIDYRELNKQTVKRTHCRYQTKFKTDSQDPKCSQSSTYILDTGNCQ